MTSPFWKDGLQFACQRCGQCCCGEPGIVYFSPSEFDALCAFLKKSKNLDRQTVSSEYMWRCRDSYTARDDFPDGHCIFFDHGCTVYDVRPSQCRDFPFWRQNLTSREAWDEAARRCPGMNSGKQWSFEEICAVADKARL